MKQDPPPPVGNRAMRAAWFAANVRPGMTLDDAVKLNDRALLPFPMTPAEREQREKDMEGMVEFVP